MPRPLPVTLYSPVSVLSHKIRVTGVLKDANVIIPDGTTEVGGVTADVDGEILVSLNTSLLVENHNLSGTQTTNDDTSAVKTATVQVQGVSLDAPTLVSVLHTCMTDVIVDGLTPSASSVKGSNGVKVGNYPNPSIKNTSMVWGRSSPCDCCRIQDRIHQQTMVKGEPERRPKPRLPNHHGFPAIRGITSTRDLGARKTVRSNASFDEYPSE